MSLDMSMLGRFAIEKRAGDIIFCEYEPGDNFYLIQTGNVKIVKIMGEIEKTIDILQPGEFFGEMAILEDSPRSATAMAASDVRLLEFNKANFEILMQGHPQIVFNLLKLFSKRIYDQKRRFMILTLNDVQARVADVFLMLDEISGEDDPLETVREFKTSTSDVAHWAGISVAECKRVLDQFVLQRRVDVKQDSIIVKNIADFSRFVSSKRNK
jgi:CRP/FNR family cyclic AMP-dependent transcriptional regulator